MLESNKSSAGIRPGVSSELPKAAKGLASKPRTKLLIVFHIPNTHKVNRVHLATETWRCKTTSNQLETSYVGIQ